MREDIKIIRSSTNIVAFTSECVVLKIQPYTILRSVRLMIDACGIPSNVVQFND